MMDDVLGVHDPNADPIRDSKGRPEPDSDLRDHENVPLPTDRVAYEPGTPTGRCLLSEGCKWQLTTTSRSTTCLCQSQGRVEAQ